MLDAKRSVAACIECVHTSKEHVGGGYTCQQRCVFSQRQLDTNLHVEQGRHGHRQRVGEGSLQALHKLTVRVLQQLLNKGDHQLGVVLRQDVVAPPRLVLH